MNDSKNNDNDDYIRKNLSQNYEESLKAHKLNYINEREHRIKKEQEEILKENERLLHEDELEKERKILLKNSNIMNIFKVFKKKKINYKKNSKKN
jgi:hypothetical protein